MEGLEIWTVYENPRDFPGLFVVRRSWSTATEVLNDPVAHPAPTLQKARRLIPAGLVRMARNERDDPVIVEMWF